LSESEDFHLNLKILNGSEDVHLGLKIVI